MKKLLFILVLLCLILVGCNQTDNTDGKTDSGELTTPVEPTPGPTIPDEPTQPEGPTISDEPTQPEGSTQPEEPTVPDGPAVDPNAPTFAPGWCDTGYKITTNAAGEYVVEKSANAVIWGGAMLDLANYSSEYSSFTVKFTTTNVTNFSIELIVSGGEVDWAENVTVYSQNLEDGEHEITVEFTNVNPISTVTWGNVAGYYIKDYTIAAIKFSLDTAVDNSSQLVNKDATCTLHNLAFEKVGTTDEPEQPTIPDQPTVPDQPVEHDPNAPTLKPGWCDSGYNIQMNDDGEYVITRLATAGKWEGASFDISNYTSQYSSFVIEFTTTNVKNFYIELIVYDGEATWTNYVNVYQTQLNDGFHKVTVDFTYTQPVDGTTWNPVPGYFIKDYRVATIRFVLDTASDEELTNLEEKCVINDLRFVKVASNSETYECEPSNTVLSFSDKNSDKVITTPTFNADEHKNVVSYDVIKPYPLFSSGMCLQRDAINRIWGSAPNAKYIAAEIKGEVYYGTISDGEWEIYLPKMNGGGPYILTIISDLGSLRLSDVYIGEVFLLSGQSNMEFQAQHGEDVLKDLYSSSDCVNSQIRMFQVGWSTPTEPNLDAINYAQWKGANQSTIYNFTAVGYLFGKQMQEELGCPIGLIANPVGGSSIEFWLSEANYNKVQESYTSYTTTDTVMTPCLGYNGMLSPLAGLNLRGVVWYQGCSNAFGTEEYYDIALKIYIEQCREIFDNEQLSFTICELARYEGNPYAYSIVNEKINYVASTDPYIAVARNLDQGDWNDIHPKDKHEIARRAAYETLRVFFNKEKAEPVKVTSYTFNADGSVTITLSSAATLVNGTNGFEVYVNGQYTYNCNVSIEGNTLTVTADGEITKVRYGYTCKMTSEIMKDVSKMVTIYDLNGFPLDLFLISK